MRSEAGAELEARRSGGAVIDGKEGDLPRLAIRKRGTSTGHTAIEVHL